MLAVAVVTMIVGAFLALSRDLAAATLPLAAAAFVAARFYTYDVYYLPTLRRMSDGGVVSAGWVYGIVVAAIVVGVIWTVVATVAEPAASAARRPARALSVAVLIICAVTAFAEGTGH